MSKEIVDVHLDLKVLYEGECCREKTCKKDCPKDYKPESCCREKTCKKDCPKDYKPVCAGDGINPPETFCNQCEMEEQNCIREKDLKVLYEGECCREKTCKKDCPKDYKPESAVGKRPARRTVQKTTSLSVFVCEIDLKVLYEGECCREKTCKKDCPKDYKPVCVCMRVLSGKDLQEGLSKRLQACLCLYVYLDLKVLYEGECCREKTCKKHCPKDYKPVCVCMRVLSGKDLQEGLSKRLQACLCLYVYLDLKVLYEGECCREKTCKKDCPKDYKLVLYEGECCREKTCKKDCPKDYKPVCAGDGINPPETFCNQCELEEQSCIKEKGYSGIRRRVTSLTCSKTTTFPTSKA
uniref:Kazal-like domain-containing protein n=1 Tax=Timema shepardi TaxID=629360 RepID=A0A7R9G1F4_TIMSH|nr:unnamed protein product [Timema shepardi]